MEGLGETEASDEGQLHKENNEAVLRQLRQGNFFAVRTTAGQEQNVLLMLEVRIKTLNLPIYSAFSLPDLKGYIVIEAFRASRCL
jgi:hypothetical protein